MDPLIILRGCDLLELVVNIPRDGRSIAEDEALARDALDSRGILTGRARFQTSGAKRSIGFPWGSLNLRVVPAAPRTLLQAWAYLHPEPLHRDFARTLRGAMESLACIYEACRPASAPAEPVIGFRSVDVHADVACFDFHPGLRFRSGRMGAGVKFSVDEAGQVDMVRTPNSVFVAYDKSADIRSRPSKAYVRELWAENGYREEMGAVWRVEFRFRNYRARDRGLHTLNDFWQYATSALEMLEEGRPDTPKALLSVHPVWDLLRSVNFPAWGAEVRSMPKLPVSREQTDAQALSVAMSRLAQSAALRGTSVESAEACYIRLVQAYFRERPGAERDQLATIERFRQKYGLGGGG